MIVVFGANGQVGKSLAGTQPAHLDVTYVTRDDCDLSKSGTVYSFLEQCQPTMIINAAAYTAVDQAESEPELARQINCDAVREMAEYTQRHPERSSEAAESRDLAERSLHVGRDDGRLIHLSTDFVFDGTSTSPYHPGDPTSPLGEYGASKLAGELAALETAPLQTMIIRTAWVYSEHGNNFVKTMLRLMGERDELGVVSDQQGSPTYARGIAESIWQIVTDDLFEPGIYHWTDEGDITWHDFAVAIQQEAIELGLLEKQIPVNAITTEQYPTPAERPAYSVLNTDKLASRLGHEAVPWQKQLRQMLGNLNLAR